VRIYHDRSSRSQVSGKWLRLRVGNRVRVVVRVEIEVWLGVTAYHNSKLFS
jgi:hypothetical protein